MNACSSAELFCRTNDRISFGRRLPLSVRMRTSRSMLAITLSYFRPRRVDSNTSLPAASTLMLIASSPASIIPRAISSVISEPLLIMPTSRIPFCFA